MEVRQYDHLGETLYYERLPNGLQVFILPKPGFRKTYATFSTHFGSIDNHFQVEGKEPVQVPDGIAHFLEHKMFEEPEGGDVFAKFAAKGASANAYTSFDRTVYLFSATNHILDNLDTLMDFVQNPYFTDANVEKEKGIIGQEINMYQDNPDWRVYFGLIEALYQVHPVHIDIAGTIESISRITKETLYECYHTFYHPGNMMMFIAGGVDPAETMERIRRNQEGKSFRSQGEIHRLFDPEPDTVRTERIICNLPVSLPKMYLGFKDVFPSNLSGKDLLRFELASRVMLDALFSPSSDLYQSLYEDGLISDGFGSDYSIGGGYAFSVIGGDTKDPEELHARIRTRLAEAAESGLAAEDFERSRRKKIGAFLRMLNSTEAIAGEYTKFAFRGIDMFDIVQVYEQLTLEEVNARLRDHVNWNRSAVSIVQSGEANR